MCKYPEKTLSQEDGACPSANYMHIGKGKFWTVVKPDFTKKLEQELAIELNWPEERVICYLRRKKLFFTTAFLRDKLGKDSYIRFEQRVGQMVLGKLLLFSPFFS